MTHAPCAWCGAPSAHWYDHEGTKPAERICFTCGCSGHPDAFVARMELERREREEREDEMHTDLRRVRR